MKWKATDLKDAKYVEIMEVDEEYFEVLQTEDKIIFGSSTNIGLKVGSRTSSR